MLSKYQELRKRITGPIFSIVTPFLQDDSIDYNSLENYITKAHESGAKHFYVMAYNSRYSQLTDDEILELNGFVAKKVKSLDTNHIVIVGDPIHCSTKTSIKFAQHAKESGADIISLIVREKLYSNEQVVTHFNEVMKHSDTAILIHEMPFLSGFNGSNIDWPVDLVEELIKKDQIVALKEDAKNDDLTAEIVKKFKDDVAIIVSGGGKERWQKFYPIGCTSWLNGIGVFEPKLATVFWKAVQAGDTHITEAIINEIERPFFKECVSRYGWHLACKAALQARGLMIRKERLPMLELDEENYNKVKSVIESLPIERVINE